MIKVVPKVKQKWFCPKCDEEVRGAVCKKCNLSYFIAEDVDFNFIVVFFFIDKVRLLSFNGRKILTNFFSIQTLDGKFLESNQSILLKRVVDKFPQITFQEYTRFKFKKAKKVFIN